MLPDTRFDSLAWFLYLYLVLFATMSNPPDTENTHKRSILESDGHWKILGHISLNEMTVEVELAQKYLAIVRRYCVIATEVTSTYPNGCRKLQTLVQRITDIEKKFKEFLKLTTAMDHMNQLIADQEDETSSPSLVTLLQNSRDVYGKSIDHIRNIQNDGMQQIVKSNNALSNINLLKMRDDSDYRAKVVKRIEELLSTDTFFLTEIVNRFEGLQNNLLTVCRTGSLNVGNQFLSKETLVIVLKEIERHLNKQKDYCMNDNRMVPLKKFILPFNANRTEYSEILDQISISCFIFGDRLSYEMKIPLVAREKYSLYHTNLL